MAKITSPVAVTFSTVKAAFPELFALSIVDAVASSYDKDIAREVIARAITGAALEWAMSGNDARLKAARAALEGKGKGQKVRALAILAIDSIKGACKARALAGSDMDTIEAWIVESSARAVDALTPVPAAPRVAKTAPSAATVAVPAIPALAENNAPAAVLVPAIAPWDDTAPPVDAIIAAIKAGAYDVTAMLAISKALGEACAPITAE